MEGNVTYKYLLLSFVTLGDNIRQDKAIYDKTMMKYRFITKAELARELGISQATLRRKMRQIEDLDTGRRQLLYPYEVKRITKFFACKKAG